MLGKRKFIISKFFWTLLCPHLICQIVFLRMDEVMSALQEFPDEKKDETKVPELSYHQRSDMFTTLLSVVSSDHTRNELLEMLPSCTIGKHVIKKAKDFASAYGDYPLYRTERVQFYSPNWSTKRSYIFWKSKFFLFLKILNFPISFEIPKFSFFFWKSKITIAPLKSAILSQFLKWRSHK